MPSRTSKGDPQSLAADIAPTNTVPPDRNDSGLDGAAPAKAAHKGNRSLLQGFQNHSTDPPCEGHGGPALGPNESGRASESVKQSSASRDSLLQIPKDARLPRPTENSVWGWDPPLDSVGDSANLYFEPQGELLQEQRDRRAIRNEFSIPTAISTPAGALNPNGTGGFTVPPKPSALQPHPLAGLKRKSASDQDTTGGGSGRDFPPQKRQERDMSDMLTDSPSDRPPAQSTRSQTATGPRMRSGTDATDSRPDSVRAGLDMSGRPRRMLTESALAPTVLPARKVFPIQIGDKLFRLSGASISSDGK